MSKRQRTANPMAHGISVPISTEDDETWMGRMIGEALLARPPVQAASKVILFAHLDNAAILWEANKVRGIKDDRFHKFGKDMTGCGQNKCDKLLKLHPFRARIEVWCEGESQASMAVGEPYHYPDWNTCFRMFVPQKPPALKNTPVAKPTPLVGDAPDPTPENVAALVDLMNAELPAAEQVAVVKANEYEAIRQRCDELEAENQRLRDELAALKSA
jgi:hypothetical protein